MTGGAGSLADLEGDSSRPLYLDDFRGGGLGARDWSVLLSRLVAARTVEFDEDDAKDSLTAANPGASSTATTSASTDKLPALLRVTGGRVFAGLFWFDLGAGILIMGATRPGD